MNYENERLLNIIQSPHVSEKVSCIIKKNNTIVLKVLKNSKKIEIKSSVQKLFNVKVKSVNTMILKGKIKKHGKYFGKNKNWKKAYVTLYKGQNLDFIEGKE